MHRSWQAWASLWLAKSPHFDPRWEANGHVENVIRLAEAHHPTFFVPLGLKDWMGKRFLNRVYWILVPTGRV